MRNIVIGIEGLVGSGKTCICKEMLNRLPNSVLFHGGNLYRGIVYAFMQKDMKLEDLKGKDISQIMQELNVRLAIEDNETVVYVNSEKMDENILQNKENSLAVSKAGGMADNSALFIFARNIINKYKEKYNVIVSGRSLMEIYPQLDYHIFITASIDERVKRKATQYNGQIDLEELKRHIMERDNLQEKAGFYKIYPNTIEVDVTNCRTVEESTNKVCEYIEELKVFS